MTRDVANWFHDREGELFTEDETPFTREELVAVIDDSVDPVQQVVVGGERYYGVIDYQEMAGWYEYTRWDDSAGEVNIGVCAKCVQQAEYVDEVSRTIGDSTDIARQKFENHYSTEHDESPSEIETGATLLSGTTINGNTAIHPGMDGSGSGVDADFVLGGGALQTGSFYSFSDTTAGEVISKTNAPSGQPFGVDIDKATDCIWTSSDNADSIYEVDHNITVTDGFSSPSDTPEGVGVDSDSCIWVAESLATDSVYKLDQNGTIVSTVFGEAGVHDMDFDSSDCLWLVAGADVQKRDKTGTLESTITPSSSSGPQGVGVDSNDCLWVNTDSDGPIKQMKRNGTILSEFSTPCSNSQGVGVDLSGSIWHANTREDAIYQLYKFDVIQF